MNIVRIFFLIFLLWISGLADVRYTSLHQKASYGSFKEQILRANSYLSLSSDIPYSSSYRLQCQSGDCIQTKNPHQKQWCGDSFMRYRLYIPPYVKQLTIKYGVRYNSSFAGIIYFVPDGSPLQSVNFKNFKVMNNKYYPYNYDFPSIDASNHYLFSGYHPLYYSFKDIGKIVFDNLFSYVSNGGWLYISLAQADKIMRSWGGYRSTPQLRMSVTYVFDDTDKMQWLKYKKFDSNGDPIENFERLKEIPKSCKGINAVWVRGNHEGSYIFDPDLPDFEVLGSRENKTITYNAKLQAGEAPLFGIMRENNQNVTISAKFDSCFQITQTASSKEGGEFFYSKDNSSWISQNEVTDLSDIHYVKYEISSPDSSGMVLGPKEALSINIKGEAKQNCTKVNALFTFSYIFKGEEKSTSKEVTITIPQSSTQASSRSSSSSSRSSTTQSSSSSDDWCTRSGGHWVDTICVGVSSSTQASSRSSSSSSRSSTTQSSSSSDDWCTRSGGHWVDTICVDASSSSQSSSSQSSSSSNSLNANDSYARDTSSHAGEIARELAGKSFDITGYFVYIGDPVEFEPFEWVYANESGTFVAKLEGYENGGFKWTRLMSNSKNIHYFDSVKIENGKLIFGDLIKNSENTSSSDDWCTRSGGHWVDTICEGAGSSGQSSSSQSSSSSVKSSSLSISSAFSSSSIGAVPHF